MVRLFAKSMGNALRGIRFVWSGERNFRIEIIVALVMMFIGELLNFSYVEFCFLTIAIGAVLSAEMLNTIVEEMLDIVEPAHAEHIGKLKDVTAGVVLLLSCCASILGIILIIHHL